MFRREDIILGINHMFLYPGCMVDGAVHERTLAELLETPWFEAIDCWIWPSLAKEELRHFRKTTKCINYNIGTRLGEKHIFPASAEPAERKYALEILKRESEFIHEVNAKKVVLASGPDVPNDREDALKRFSDLILEWAPTLPKDAMLTIEPVDWDIHKRYLLGTAENTCRCVQMIRDGGFSRVGILLDMSHIPLMHETLQSAPRKMGPFLEHIHLGSCVVSDPTDPLYGDKHPCWGYPNGAYDMDDGVTFLKELCKVGHFQEGEKRTVTFEMRPLLGKTADETQEILSRWFDSVKF